MSIIFTIFLILCGSVFLSTIFKRRVEETIIFYIFSAIVFVYIFGIIGHLVWGVYGFIIISMALFITEIVLFIKDKNKKEFLKRIFTPGLLIFFILNVVLFYFERGRMFVEWDEFSHWGSAIKSMFEINDFATNPNSSLMFQSYPPAMTIFQYIFLTIKGQFIEYYAFYSYGIFCISLLLPFTAKLEWKNVTKIIAYTLLIIIVPTFIFDNFYRSVYIDAAIGLTFGFIISKIISTKKEYSIYDLLLIYLSLIIIVLQKDTGMFFAIIAICMLGIDVFIFKNRIKLKKENLKQIKRNLLLIAIPIILILIARASWSYSIKTNDADVMFSGSYNVKEIIKIIIGKDTSYRTTVMEKFIEKCFNKAIFENIVSLNTVQFGIAFCIIFLIAAKICKCNKRENIFITIVMLGLIVYLFGLMITYMYKFNQTEALALASFTRYVKIYFAGISFISAYIFMDYKEIDNKTICIFALIVMLVSPLQSIQQLHKTINSSITDRAKYIDEANKIEAIVNEDEKLFFIDKENPDCGYTYWIIRYSLIPIKFNTNEMFNITAVSENSNKYIVYYPFEKFKQTVFNEYDYVYIRSLDNDFKNEYGILFENLTEHSLYKVEEEKLVKIY